MKDLRKSRRSLYQICAKITLLSSLLICLQYYQQHMATDQASLLKYSGTHIKIILNYAVLNQLLQLSRWLFPSADHVKPARRWRSCLKLNIHWQLLQR